MKLAFGYKMGVGKDTAVAYLMDKYGGEQISFSKPLYDILYYAQNRCGLTLQKDRQFLQYVGTEWCRKQEPDLLVRLALESVSAENHCYISDLRFLNEFHALKQAGFFCVKINRHKQEERKGSGSHEHISETALDALDDEEWDCVIDNNDTLKDFYSQLEHTVKLCHTKQCNT